MLALVGLGRSAYLDAIDRAVLPRQAAADIFDALIGLLRTGVRLLAVVAVVVALLALVLGRTDRLRAIVTSPRLAWVRDHRRVLQGLVVALGGIVLFAWDPPTATVVLIDLALVAGGVILIAAIARTVATSTRDGPAPG
jgi:uncharacterized membrane protein